MDNQTILLILFAAFLHATWNALLKSQTDRIVGLNAQLLASTVYAAIWAIYLGIPDWSTWVYIIPAALLHFFYHLLLLSSYRLADMNLAYPILRGSAPLIATLIAFFFLAEVPSVNTIIGIMTICGGIALLAKGSSWRSILTAMSTATVIASYSVVDAVGARVNGDGWQYAVWLLMLDSFFFLPIALRQRGWRALLRAPPRTYLFGIIGGVCSVSAYSLIVVAYTKAPIGAVAALRETSIIIGALIGYYILKEKATLRIPGACIIALGAMLIVYGKN